VLVANLFALLVGFALLARHFEESRIPLILPRVMPDDWKGWLVLLAMVFVLSSFLDNIAAAMIAVRWRVRVGFLAALFFGTFAAWLDRVPVIGLAVWLALLGTATVARPDWSGRGARLASRLNP